MTLSIKFQHAVVLIIAVLTALGPAAVQSLSPGLVVTLLKGAGPIAAVLTTVVGVLQSSPIVPAAHSVTITEKKT